MLEKMAILSYEQFRTAEQLFLFPCCLDFHDLGHTSLVLPCMLKILPNVVIPQGDAHVYFPWLNCLLILFFFKQRWGKNINCGEYSYYI